MGLHLQNPNPTCIIKRDSGEVIPAEKKKAELRRWLEQKTWEAVHEQNWREKLISARSGDESLNFEGCFWWLSGWKQCPTHTVTGIFELYEQLLPTRLYACQKTHTDTTGEVMCRLLRTLKVLPMSWLVVLPLHRKSTLPDITQPWRYFSSRLCKT